MHLFGVLFSKCKFQHKRKPVRCRQWWAIGTSERNTGSWRDLKLRSLISTGGTITLSNYTVATCQQPHRTRTQSSP